MVFSRTGSYDTINSCIFQSIILIALLRFGNVTENLIFPNTFKLNELRHEKTGLPGFRPGLT